MSELKRQNAGIWRDTNSFCARMELDSIMLSYEKWKEETIWDPQEIEASAEEEAKRQLKLLQKWKKQEKKWKKDAENKEEEWVFKL